MKRLLMITYAFPPDGGAGVQRPAKFAKYLPQFAWEPVVLTRGGPASEFVDESLLDEVQHVRVHRVHPLPWRRSPQILNWVLPAARQALRLVRREGIQVALTTSPPDYIHVLGYLLKAMCRVPWVADLRDPWADHPLSAEHTPWRRIADRCFEGRFLSRADAVVVTSSSLAAHLDGKYGGFLHNRLRIIRNGYDPDDLRGLNAHKTEPRMVICYNGSFNRWRSPRTFFEALVRFLNKDEERRSKVTVTIAGHLGRENEQLVREMGLNEVVRSLGYLPHRESLDVLCRSDVGLLVLSAEESRFIVPAKLYEYLALGKPVLALTTSREITQMLTEAGQGWVADPEDAAQAAAKLEELWGWWRNRCLTPKPPSALIEAFERPKLAADLAALLDHVQCQKERNSSS